MATYILVPGGWQGGWAFDKVAKILTDNGHQALQLTLSGLGDTPAPKANLDLHIGELVDAVKASADDPVVVGHSYGGMVLSGAADTLPSSIKALVYVDAYVPTNGDSVWSLTTPRFRDAFIAGTRADGLNCLPSPTMDVRCRPHPIGTFLQAIALSGRWRDVPQKTFIGAHGWEGSPFLDLYENLIADAAWSTYSLDCGHNIARERPEALCDILMAQL
ncbi:pimeloyl-ACP methyl ester carboxylesterase [Devosia sp. UYZn731]|uniref:alpha/beta fold hydrolase n=1 Tax=Devosia sp. UYZn731 TaxID=3156345 RepID=UPI00339AF2B1